MENERHNGNVRIDRKREWSGEFVSLDEQRGFPDFCFSVLFVLSFFNAKTNKWLAKNNSLRILCGSRLCVSLSFC